MDEYIVFLLKELEKDIQLLKSIDLKLRLNAEIVATHLKQLRPQIPPKINNKNLQFLY